MGWLSPNKWIQNAYSPYSTVLRCDVVLFINFCVGDEQTGGGDSSFPESCRTADSDPNWSLAITVGNGLLQNTDPWVQKEERFPVRMQWLISCIELRMRFCGCQRSDAMFDWQVIMMELLLCSQRCSTCVRREDYSSPAPTPLSVWT